MTSSLTILAAYAALLLVVLLTPYAARQLRMEKLAGLPLCATLLSGALILTFARQDVPLLGAFLLLPLIGLGAASLTGGATAVLLFATVIWWWPNSQLNSTPSAVFIVLSLVAASLPHWKQHNRSAEGKLRLLTPMLFCAGIGLTAGLVTAPFESTKPLYTAWHHWSALLSPVEAWRGGGVPYRDFPIQYGLGPTALLLASCAGDCWRGMFYTAVIINALYFTTLSGCAMLLLSGASRGLRWLAFIALFCACFIWTGFPIHLAGPAMTPAVAGLRFLTISGLLLYILVAEHRHVRRDWIGHLIWLADLFWSPEAGFFATVIWWPYLAMRSASEADDAKAAWIALLRGAVRGTVALALGACLLLLALWLLSDGSVTAEAFFTYIQHPPGTKPIKSTGTIWIAVASISIGVAVLARQGFSSYARCFYVCLLGFVAAGAYYLSRSHDNNILNLFPLLVLVLLAIVAGLERRDGPAQSFFKGFAQTTLAAMIAFVSAFNYGPWKEGLSHAALSLGPARMLVRLTPTQGNASPLSADAVEGLDYLRQRNAGMVVLFDEARVIPRSSKMAWTSVNNVANFEPLPGTTILKYIHTAAETYRQPGWILVGPKFGAWTNAFKTAYHVRNQKCFGHYVAYYMIPRSAGADAAVVEQAAASIDRAKRESSGST